MAKERNPKIKIGIVTPVRNSDRKPSADLHQYADWLRHSIKPNELARCQLPDQVLTRKRSIRKPEHW